MLLSQMLTGDWEGRLGFTRTVGIPGEGTYRPSFLESPLGWVWPGMACTAPEGFGNVAAWDIECGMQLLQLLPLPILPFLLPSSI